MRRCTCKACKKAAKKGLKLGSRKMGFWIKGISSGEMEYYYGYVSAYVIDPRYKKRKYKRENNNSELVLNY